MGVLLKEVEINTSWGNGGPEKEYKKEGDWEKNLSMPTLKKEVRVKEGAVRKFDE